MKYIIMDEGKNDTFTQEYNNRDEAIKDAEHLWNVMSRSDRKRCRAFYVLESANPDPEAVDHLDGDVVMDLMEMQKRLDQFNDDLASIEEELMDEDLPSNGSTFGVRYDSLLEMYPELVEIGWVY